MTKEQTIAAAIDRNTRAILALARLLSERLPARQEYASPSYSVADSDRSLIEEELARRRGEEQ